MIHIHKHTIKYIITVIQPKMLIQSMLVLRHCETGIFV